MRGKPILAAVSGMLLSACLAIFDFSGFETTAAFDASGSPIDFTVAPTPLVRVERGTTITVPLAVERRPGFDAPILVEIVDAPTGIVLRATPIDQGKSEAPLTVTATENTALGVSLVANLVFRNANIARPLALNLLVTGAPGTLDTTFGDGGIVFVTPPSDLAGRAAGTAVALDDAGATYVGASNLLTRLGRDGTIDPAFPPTFGRAFVHHLQLDGDGRVVLSERDTLVTRFLPDGRRDTSFGDGGAVASCPGCGLAEGLAPRGDGWLLPIVDFLGAEPTVRLAALTRDGTHDTSFGDAGIVTLVDPPDSSTQIAVNDFRRLVDGRYVLAGGEYQGGTASAGLLFFTDGGPPSTVRDTSLVTAHCILDVDGQRYVVAETSTAGPIGVVAYGQDGGRDPTFGSGGLALLATSSVPCDLARDGDGRLLAAAGRLYRFTNKGVLDARFGVGGMTVGTFGVFDLEWRAVAIATDDRIVVVGTYRATGIDGHGTVAGRYWP